MELAIQILHVLVCVFLVLVILLQAGKGAGIGAVFGGAGSQTVFGGRGAQTFLGRLTTIGAAVYFLTSLTLSYTGGDSGRSVVEGELAPAAPVAPAPGADVAKPSTPPTAAPPVEADPAAEPPAPTPAPAPTEAAPAEPTP